MHGPMNVRFSHCVHKRPPAGVSTPSRQHRPSANISQYPQFSTASSCQLQLKAEAEGPPLDGCPGLVIERIRYLKSVFLLCPHFEDARCNVYKQTINCRSHSMRADCSSCYFMYHHGHQKVLPAVP